MCPVFVMGGYTAHFLNRWRKFSPFGPGPIKSTPIKKFQSTIFGPAFLKPPPCSSFANLWSYFPLFLLNIWWFPVVLGQFLSSYGPGTSENDHCQGALRRPDLGGTRSPKNPTIVRFGGRIPPPTWRFLRLSQKYQSWSKSDPILRSISNFVTILHSFEGSRRDLSNECKIVTKFKIGR